LLVSSVGEVEEEVVVVVVGATVAVTVEGAEDSEDETVVEARASRGIMTTSTTLSVI
jgi:hypothetical protein